MKCLLLFSLILHCTIPSIAQDSSLKSEDSLKSAHVISKYLNALGDSKSISSIRITLTGKTQGMDSEMKILKKAPNKFSVESFLNGKSISKQISNGNQFVMLVQNYQIPVDEATKELGIFEWSMIPELRLKELNIKIAYKGIVVEGGSKYELIEYKFPSGHKILNYFDRENGMKIKTVREQMSAMGNISITSKISDYRVVQGFKFPFEIVQSMGDIEQKMSVTSIEVNIELEDNSFKTEK